MADVAFPQSSAGCRSYTGQSASRLRAPSGCGSAALSQLSSVTKQEPAADCRSREGRRLQSSAARALPDHRRCAGSSTRPVGARVAASHVLNVRSSAAVRFVCTFWVFQNPSSRSEMSLFPLVRFECLIVHSGCKNNNNNNNNP